MAQRLDSSMASFALEGRGLPSSRHTQQSLLLLIHLSKMHCFAVRRLSSFRSPNVKLHLCNSLSGIGRKAIASIELGFPWDSAPLLID